jgi:hypothetical protein
MPCGYSKQYTQPDHPILLKPEPPRPAFFLADPTPANSQKVCARSQRTKANSSHELLMSCIGRESNPGLADIWDRRSMDGNGQFYH